jgi:hypothetical protein
MPVIPAFNGKMTILSGKNVYVPSGVFHKFSKRKYEFSLKLHEAGGRCGELYTPNTMCVDICPCSGICSPPEGISAALHHYFIVAAYIKRYEKAYKHVTLSRGDMGRVLGKGAMESADGIVMCRCSFASGDTRYLSMAPSELDDTQGITFALSQQKRRRKTVLQKMEIV